MKFCSHCGKEIMDEAMICPHCGCSVSNGNQVKVNYITVKEAAKKWGYSEATIRKWCKESKISVTFKAEKKSGQWQIPSEAKCPKKIKK